MPKRGRFCPASCHCLFAGWTPTQCCQDEAPQSSWRFFKRFKAIELVKAGAPTLSPRVQQLAGLSMAYATVVLAANQLFCLLSIRQDSEAQAFVLRVVDCMLPATRSLADMTLGEELRFASAVHDALSGAFPTYDAAFVAQLCAKWTAVAVVQMRRERGLLDASEKVKRIVAADNTCRRVDVAEHGLKYCALPSCDKREASVQQYKFCSACRSVWYCSEEHGALHWTEHKPVCRATTAAQQAADGAGGGAP